MTVIQDRLAWFDEITVSLDDDGVVALTINVDAIRKGIHWR